MRIVKKNILRVLLLATIFGLGALTAYTLSQYKFALATLWDRATSEGWNEDFTIIEIPTEDSNEVQLAYAHLIQSEESKPLVVSLHAWVDDYSKPDPLSILVSDENWNYIHPDFQGPNWTKDACLSQKALSDIDTAIDYAIKHGSVDMDNIFVVGASGGGYAALGSYLRSKHQVKGFQSWVPISDLTAWYYQSLSRNYEYAEHILKCTSDGEILDLQAAKERSPLFWEIKGSPTGTLDIYAGIKDGYSGSVPLSHSILFYNRLVKEYGYPEAIVSEKEITSLLTQGIAPTTAEEYVGGRKVLFSRGIPEVSISIFQGGHEMFRDHALLRMQQLYKGSINER